MFYNNANEYQKREFLTKAHAIAEKGEVVELTVKTARSLNQNAYLHLLLGIVANYVGTSAEDVKYTYYKKEVNPVIFVRTITDKFTKEEREYIRSSKEITKEEMSLSIERFKHWARENDIFLPEPGDKELLLLAQVELNRIEQYI